jgi:multicomponent K+:H+ antiporter subunit E
MMHRNHRAVALPFPVVSASLFLLWLLLNQTISLGHILLGSAVGLIGGWALVALDDSGLRCSIAR